MPIARLATGIELADSGSFSADGKFLAAGSSYYDQAIKIWQIGTWQLVASFVREPTPPGTIGERALPLSFNPSNDQLAFAAGSLIHVRDVTAAQSEFTLSGHTGRVTALAFSPDGHLLASTAGFVRFVKLFDSYRIERDTGLRIWDVENRKQIQMLDPPHAVSPIAFSFSQNITCSDCVRQIAFSPDGRWLAGSLANKIRVWETGTWSEVYVFEASRAEWAAIAWSKKGILAGATRRGAITFWDPSNHKEWHAQPNSIPIDGLQFTPDGLWLFSSAVDGVLKLWEVSTGGLRATLVAMYKANDWLVVSPDGLFDGSPAAWNQALWRFQGSLETFSVEAFFTEFFYPGLLSDILAGKDPHADTTIKDKDRRQPHIELALIDHSGRESISSRTVKLQIKVVQAPADAIFSQAGGLRDVRLFRNGSLVKAWHGDVLTRGSSEALLPAEVAIVAGENRLTAYAFNRDNVKTSDATLVVSGSESLNRKGTAFILAVGINQYSNPDFNLRYAVADSQDFAQQLGERLKAGGRFAEIQIVTLSDRDATRANLLTALQRLAGARDDLTNQPQSIDLARLRAVQPEDAIFIYFAGHGAASESRFYLIPFDLGYMGPRDEMDEGSKGILLSHGLSDVELEQAVEQIDSGQLVMVINACRSGQSYMPTTRVKDR